MINSNRSIPKWILLVSGLFALLEISVSFLLCFSPQSAAESVDVTAKGVDYLLYMWAARQFALGFILGFATYKKSVPMLTVGFVFLLVMFLGDLLIGIVLKNDTILISGLAMSIVSAAMLYAINKIKGNTGTA